MADSFDLDFECSPEAVELDFTFSILEGMEEAPVDGKQYARKDGDWVEVTASSISTDASLSGEGTSTNPLSVTGLITFNIQSDDYALQVTDAKKHIILTKSVTTYLTINDVFTEGQQCTVEQNGIGQVVVLAGAGVNIKVADNNLKTRVQYSGFVIIKTPTAGEYALFGDLTT
jgi:hypothetical protein